MMPVEFLTIPDRVALVMDRPMRAQSIRAAMLERDPGKPAPTVGAIRATLSRSVDRFERVGRGLCELKEVRRG